MGVGNVAYHRPTHGCAMMRKACLEPITFNPDSTISEVEMTTQGAGGPISPVVRMDAVRACLMEGNVRVKVHRPAHDVPVEYLAGIQDGDYAYWKYYDFDLAKVNYFVCKTWDKNKAAKIEIRLDAPDRELIGTCEVKPMQEEVAYAIHETKIKSVRGGKHALVLVFRGTDKIDIESALMNLEWFTFINKE